MSWNRLIEGAADPSNKKAHSREDSLQFSDNKPDLTKAPFEDSINNLHIAFSTPVKSGSSLPKDEVVVSYSQLVEVLDLISRANHSNDFAMQKSRPSKSDC